MYIDKINEEKEAFPYRMSTGKCRRDDRIRK